MLRGRDVILLENTFNSELTDRETQVNGGITFIMPLLLLPIPKNQRVSMKLSMERIQSSGKKQLTVNESLLNNNTWDLLELPEGKNVVEIKKNADGTAATRLVCYLKDILKNLEIMMRYSLP